MCTYNITPLQYLHCLRRNLPEFCYSSDQLIRIAVAFLSKLYDPAAGALCLQPTEGANLKQYLMAYRPVLNVNLEGINIMTYSLKSINRSLYCAPVICQESNIL